MPTRIKNCGLRTADSIHQSAASGATFVGFVHHEASPRHLPLDEMAQLAAIARPKLKTVAVLVAPSDALLDDLVKHVAPDYIQLHALDIPRIQAISVRYETPIISAMSVTSAADLTYALEYEAISKHVLFDAKHPGGGQPFDWHLLKNIPLRKPWFLAGGLTAANVGEALRITQAPMVDVSSGIEDAPGHKSLEKIAAFNAAVLGSA